MFMALVMTLVMTKITVYDSASKRLRGKRGREFESGKTEQGLLGGFIVFSSPGKLQSLCESRLT